MNRLEVEAKSVGGNERALSQALTWLGSHDRHIGHWTKTQLTSLGTEILENSLPHVLPSESLIQGNGMYGMVLPERVLSH